MTVVWSRPPSLFTDRRERDVQVLAQDVHDDLARLDHFFFARLVIDDLLADVVEVRDGLDHVFDSDVLFWFGAVLEEILYLER